MMQTDVISGHLNGSGQVLLGRTRLRGIVIVGTATAGTINVWDSTTAPVTSGTYARTGNTITVTSSSHGLITGQQVGITFGVGTGGTGTNGNYFISVTTSSTFTITDINTGSITAGAACSYVASDKSNHGPWVTSFDTAAVTSGANVMQLTLPGEGILCHNGIYIQATNTTGITAFYG